MPAEIVTVKGTEAVPDGLSRAARVVLSGGIVAVPTESFYGLSVNASDEQAIHRLLGAKRIEGGHPILLLVSSVEMLKDYVQDIPPIARRLIDRFWPGGLTLVMEAGPSVSTLLTAGTEKIGIRLSSHPVATGLAHAVGLPITGTSANITGSKPCVSADEVQASLGNDVDLILDGGRTEGGKGSTVIDLASDPPRIVREGMITRAELREFLPE
jgi:L-threonylcarbamoyladenylate synthase